MLASLHFGHGSWQLLLHTVIARLPVASFASCAVQSPRISRHNRPAGGLYGSLNFADEDLRWLSSVVHDEAVSLISSPSRQEGLLMTGPGVQANLDEGELAWMRGVTSSESLPEAAGG